MINRMGDQQVCVLGQATNVLRIKMNRCYFSICIVFAGEVEAAGHRAAQEHLRQALHAQLNEEGGE